MVRTTRGKSDRERGDSHVCSVALIALAMVACGSKHEPQPAAKGSSAPVVAPGDAQAAVALTDAPPASAILDLFRAVPATIRVSSRVNNKAIKPAHIADQNLETAWNSQTDELVGAWIEVSVENAQMQLVKLTVGHTGHGPKGEDYFTMNPRIRSVTIDDGDGTRLGTYDLDIAKRELQAIAVTPKHDTIRITVAAIEPGTKKNWREAAVSELEVWGTPGPTWKPPKQPLVPFVEVDGVVEHGDDPCAGIEKERAQWQREHAGQQTGPDNNNPPDCSPFDLPADVSQFSQPWSGAVAACRSEDELYGPKHCMIAFKAGGATDMLEVPPGDQQDVEAGTTVTLLELEQRDIEPGGRPELVTRFKIREDEWLGVCFASPSLSCTMMWKVTGETDEQAIAKHLHH